MTTSPVNPRVTLIGRPGCHLCEEARSVVERVCASLGESWLELSIDEDPELARTYAEQIPVVLVDGRQHSYWHVEERALADALAGRRRWRLGRPRGRT